MALFYNINMLLFCVKLFIMNSGHKFIRNLSLLGIGSIFINNSVFYGILKSKGRRIRNSI